MISDAAEDPFIRKLESSGAEDNAPKPLKQINQYLLIRTLGHGSFAKVYLAIDQNDRKEYAVKRFRIPELQRIDNGVNQLEREISNMRQFCHPNIMKLREVLFDKNRDVVYLVLEYADGGSLEMLIADGQKLTIPSIRSIFLQIIDALSYLSSLGKVHQDVKPSNILLCSDGRAVLADFGVGHSFQSTEAVVGSPGYQAPEALADDPIERMSAPPSKEDVWSLGITLYQALFSTLPYQGESVFEIIRNIRSSPLIIPAGAPPDACDLLKGMLTVDPSRRMSIKDVQRHKFFKGAKSELRNIIKGRDPVISDPDAEIVRIDAKVCDGSISFARPGLTPQDKLRAQSESPKREISIDLIPPSPASDAPLEELKMTKDGCCGML